MAKNSLKPTLSQTFRIVHDEEAKGTAVDFSAELARSRRAEQNGRWEEACDIRFAAVQSLVELLLYSSAVDFFLVGDWEMAAAQLEMVLDVDSEDHLEATTLLAFVYVMLEEWESLDDTLPDLDDKSPEKTLLVLWSGFVRSGKVDAGTLAAFKRYHAAYHRELCATDHPADNRYMADIASERPSKEALARELWFQTQHIWAANSEFIEMIKG